MILYQSLIPLNPKTKKNNQDIMFRSSLKGGFYKKTVYGFKYVGIPFISQNNRYKQYENDAGWFLKKIPKPISEPVNVKCIFYREDETRCDLTNLLEAIDDILVHYKILKDDNFKIIVGHDGSRVYVDREHPRTEIEITSMSDV
jgi:Holliday junction resolvase RusA-like endonuclease